VRRSGTFVDGVLYMAVETDGRLVGEVDVRRGSTGLPSGVFELGVELYEERSRGEGFGSEAIELVVEYLFEQEAAERLEARTAVDNEAMCRVLEKLGFVREGVLRGYVAGEAGRSDYVIYGLLRNEWHRAVTDSTKEDHLADDWAVRAPRSRAGML
jgi:ribosomal-protein-alanine N-acetyltransferase